MTFTVLVQLVSFVVGVALGGLLWVIVVDLFEQRRARRCRAHRADLVLREMTRAYGLRAAGRHRRETSAHGRPERS